MCVRRHLRLYYVMGLRIPGLNLLCLDRNRHGGGVAMYMKSSSSQLLV